MFGKSGLEVSGRLADVAGQASRTCNVINNLSSNFFIHKGWYYNLQLSSGKDDTTTCELSDLLTKRVRDVTFIFHNQRWS